MALRGGQTARREAANEDPPRHNSVQSTRISPVVFCAACSCYLSNEFINHNQNKWMSLFEIQRICASPASPSAIFFRIFLQEGVGRVSKRSGSCWKKGFFVALQNKEKKLGKWPALAPGPLFQEGIEWPILSHSDPIQFSQVPLLGTRVDYLILWLLFDPLLLIWWLAS